MFPLGTNSKQLVQSIFVLCSHRMREIYRLLESLLKSYVSLNISVVYVTFDEIKSFLIKYTLISTRIFPENTSKSTAFQNSHHTSVSTTSNETNSLQQSSATLLQSIDIKQTFNTNVKVNIDDITSSISE